MLFLRGVTGAPRDEATSRIRDAFAEAGAWIVDVRFFSGICTVFAFEAAASDMDRLGNALAAAGLTLDDASRQALAAPAHGEVTGWLNVTFTHGDPDLRIEVPQVPG